MYIDPRSVRRRDPVFQPAFREKARYRDVREITSSVTRPCAPRANETRTDTPAGANKVRSSGRNKKKKNTWSGKTDSVWRGFSVADTSTVVDMSDRDAI